MKIILSKEQIEQAISDYFENRLFSRRLKIEAVKLRRKSSKTEELGSIDVEISEHE